MTIENTMHQTLPCILVSFSDRKLFIEFVTCQLKKLTGSGIQQIKYTKELGDDFVVPRKRKIKGAGSGIKPPGNIDDR